MAAALYGSIVKLVSERELRLDFENAKLRQLLAQAGIDAAEQKVMEACNAFCWKNYIIG